MTQPLQLGDPAPNFQATAIGGDYGEGREVRLSDFAGRRVILYFYPKDDTPGCTTQACGIRDHWETLSSSGAEIFGVSIDDSSSHEKFIKKFQLPFSLLSDPSRRMVEDYGVWVEKSMYGKRYMGTERTTFVIGADGRIEHILRKVAPAKHIQLLKEALS